jgi:hypothetical protein
VNVEYASWVFRESAHYESRHGSHFAKGEAVDAGLSPF